jgi:RNA-directed DNA polymerase
VQPTTLGVVSRLLSNILLTPFHKEMRHKGYQLTRWADGWVVTCGTRVEATTALARATKILEKLGVTLTRDKTRIVHIAQDFEFLGFKIGRGKGRFWLKRNQISSKLNRQNLYAVPTQKSLDRFKDQIRTLTQRKVPLRMGS